MLENDSNSRSFNESKNGSYLGSTTRVRRLSESRLSPARLCRQQERQQLCSLNDRLAQYIDKVRRLELENQKLVKTMVNYETQRESCKMAEIYKLELSEAKSLMQEMSTENDNLRSETKVSREKFARLTEKLNGLQNDVDQSRQKRQKSEEELQSLEKRTSNSQARIQEFKNEHEYLAQENEKIRAEIKILNSNFLAQRQLVKENEIALEKRLEEFRLYKKNALQELEVCQEKESYVQELDQNLETIYSNKLHQHLMQMRRELDDKIEKNRSEIEENYNSKLESLHSAAEIHYQSELESKKQIQIFKLKLESYDSIKMNVESKLAESQREIENLICKLAKCKEDYDSRLEKSQTTIEKLRNQLNDMLNNYETLMGSKVQICKEIEQFQKMLEGEEKRLCLSPIVEQTGTASKRKIVKAKRLLEPNFEYQFNLLSSKSIKIAEIDLNKKFIKICNESNDVDVFIGAWILECKVDDQEQPVVYRFHNKLSLKAGKTCTIYSSNSTEIEHNPPEILLMKNLNWPSKISKTASAILRDSSNEEISSAELNRIEIFTPVDYPEDIKNGHSIAGEAEKSAKCSIM